MSTQLMGVSKTPTFLDVANTTALTFIARCRRPDAASVGGMMRAWGFIVAWTQAKRRGYQMTTTILQTLEAWRDARATLEHALRSLDECMTERLEALGLPRGGYTIPPAIALARSATRKHALDVRVIEKLEALGCPAWGLQIDAAIALIEAVCAERDVPN
jgi:hypothetical protein